MMSHNSNLSLNNVRWALVSDDDARARQLSSRGIRGFRNAASAQSVYFDAGSLAEYAELTSAFAGLAEQQYPRISDVQGLLRQYGPTQHYGLENRGSTWWLRNTSSNDFSSPFANRNARLFIEHPTGLKSYDIAASLVPGVLALMERLCGAYSMDDLLGLTDDRRILGLIGEFLVDGVVANGPKPIVELGSLPELHFLGHSSFVLRSAATVVVVDPVCLPVNTARCRSEGSVLSVIRGADAVVISHHHWDHLHFQTLCRLPRDKRIVVPRVRNPTFTNPPVASYLHALGFTNVEEVTPGECIALGDVIMRTFELRGEPFGKNSVFDGFTYHFTFSGRTLYGSVDACFDEKGDMESTIERVAQLGPLDFFLFGSSGQRHLKPYRAAGVRCFTNELQRKSETMRYHPRVVDAQRWARRLRPQVLIPYAQFLFGSGERPDVSLDALLTGREHDGLVSQGSAIGHREWCRDLQEMSRLLETPIVRLDAQQGVRFDC